MLGWYLENIYGRDFSELARRVARGERPQRRAAADLAGRLHSQGHRRSQSRGCRPLPRGTAGEGFPSGPRRKHDGQRRVRGDRARARRLRASRGEIWLADLDPPRGTEPGKTRPVLIVQAQALNDAGHPSTLVIPLTSVLKDDAEPLRIRVPASGKLKRESDLIVDQLRAIDNRRLVGSPLAQLSPQVMKLS